MQGAYGGLVVIINYSSGVQADIEDFALLTENNIFILTELSDEILV